ncbi:MAG: glutathione S-transferase [Gammaproteobacteria bacterium]|nr:glutathione S-transferase [Gammaproteobacteria bacterium]MDH3465418.1 glutathione S-transferase [Gammaproteobacteria bacterium]
MKLYGSYTSPFVRHCRVALAQAGFDFEFIEADNAMSAEKSPTGKVPFFADGDLTLTDSSSILKYIREKAGGGFLTDIEDYENFALTNTVLDSSINLFLLEKEGFGPDQIKYLGRQKNRIETGLKELNRRFDPNQGITRDSALRCACYVDWALFRNRISIDGLDNLQGLLDVANDVEEFAATAPPR